VCPIVELALGMGAGFLVAASCDCDGDLATGLTLSCGFDQCAPGSNSEICGRVDLNFVFGGPDGTVDMTACVDFEGDRFEETCFSYTIDVTLNNGSGSSSSLTQNQNQNRVFDQACEATYGGNPCECNINNGLCLSLDCSMYVPGAKIDTCQMLTMADNVFDGNTDADGNINGALESWIPGFDIFQENFQLRADDISWEMLDFQNLDFDAFDVPAIAWNGFGLGAQTNEDGENEGDGDGERDNNMTERTWMDLIGPDSNPTFLDAEGIAPGVCTLLSRVANLSDELGIEGSCVCGYDESTGLMDVSCAFSESCANEHNNDNEINNDNGVLTNLDNDLGDEPLEDNVDSDNSDGNGNDNGDGDGGLLGLCGSVSLHLTYGSLSEIYAETCIEYSDFPETCYSYGIPLAAETIILVPGTDTGTGTGTDTGLGPAFNNDNGDNQDPVKIDVSTPASRECSARYGLNNGNNNCKCTIDSNACLTVDCTDFEPLARTDECQVVDLAGAISPSRMVLNFQTPVEGAIVSDGDGSPFVAAGAQQQSSSNSVTSSSSFGGAVVVLLVIVSTTTGFVMGQLA